MPPASSELLIVRVTPKGASRLRRNVPWCYRTELLEAPSTRPPAPGSVVGVADAQGNWIGQAFWASRSPIALRLLTRERPGDEAIDDTFFSRRLERALRRRAPLEGRDALRLVHGEGDLLPGLFVDRYGEGLVMQVLSEGMEARKERLAALLAERTGARCVLARNDGSGRDFEGLPREVRFLAGGPPARFDYHEGENSFGVDLEVDMKTGSFLDQVDNHLRAGEL